jgi:hypothetical protein
MGLLFLKSIFGFVTSWFSSAWKFITTYPKQALIILCLVCAAYGGWKVKSSFDELKKENVALVAKADLAEKRSEQLKLDVATAVKVNKENQEVIATLSVRAMESTQMVEDLKKKQAVVKTRIEYIRENIAESKPEDDAPIAKVLKDTIKAIQEDRKAAQ